MNKNIEIEYKQLLTKQEYEKIKAYLLTQAVVKKEQENYYFETRDYQLKNAGQMIRIRVLNNQYELCRKTQREFDLVEENIMIEEQEAAKIFEDASLIANYFVAVPVGLKMLGVLKTARIEYHYQKGLICLDKSNYLLVEDYEIEYEASDYESEDDLKMFLKQFNIAYYPNLKNKIQRFNEAIQRKVKYDKCI